MTRKDYVVIATALGQAFAEAPRKDWEGVKSCIEHVSHALQVENPRFNASKFKNYIQKITNEILK